MINRLFIAAVILSLLPAATAFGQELRKEKLIGTNPGNPGSNYAVFYSYGMSESAVWPLGMKLLVKNADGTNGSTIRHTHDKGNGENIPVNDKVPFPLYHCSGRRARRRGKLGSGHGNRCIGK